MKRFSWFLLLIVTVFIIVPILLVLKESFLGKRPFTEKEFKEAVQVLLEKVPEEKKNEWRNEWLGQTPEAQKIESYTKILRSTLKRENLDFQGMGLKDFEEQIQKLNRPEQDQFNQALMLELAYQKRSVFIFKIRPFITKKQFNHLRGGYKKIWTTKYYYEFFQTRYLWGSFIRSINVAVYSTILTVILAYVFAFTINRTTCRFKSFFNAMALFPLVSPPVIMAFSLVLLFGRNGLVTKVLLEETLHWIHADSFNIYGMHGIIISQIFTFLPMAFVILNSTLSHLDTRVEEAAENLGASRWYTFRRVNVPMSYPGILQAALVVFTLAMHDFGNPRVIGSEYTMIAGVVYDQMIGFQNSSLAGVLGVMMMIPSLFAFLLGNFWLSKKSFVSKETTGISYIKETPKVPKIILESTCFLFSFFVLVLFLTIVGGSFVNIWGVDHTFTLKYYMPSTITGAGSSVLDASSSEGLPLIFQSIKVMGLAALIGGVLAVVMGYVVARLKGILSKILGYVVFMPSALPGVIFAIGYILAFNAPFGEAALALTGTIWILILIIVFTKIVAGVLATQSVLQKADVSVEEAAISLGANRFYAFRRVIFPVLKKAWLLGSLYVFVSGLVSLTRMIFLVTPEYQLAAPAIYLNAVEGKYGIAGVLSTYLIIVVLIAMILTRFIEKRDKYARVVTIQSNAKSI